MLYDIEVYLKSTADVKERIRRCVSSLNGSNVVNGDTLNLQESITTAHPMNGRGVTPLLVQGTQSNGLLSGMSQRKGKRRQTSDTDPPLHDQTQVERL